MAYWNEELETMPWADVERWQAGQLAVSIRSVRARSKFYSALLNDFSSNFDIRDFSDLQALPFTFKDGIRGAQESASDEFPLGANQGAPTSDIVQIISSSGTTGAPLYYGLTAGDVDRFADAIANTFFTAGVRPADIVAHLVGLPMVAGGLPYADGFRRIGASLCWLGGFPTERILREMRRLRVTALLSTTSFGLYLSERWAQLDEELGVPSRLTKILCGGEPGLNQAGLRESMKIGLGTSHLRETMGLGDVVSAMWGECEAESGMHFNAQKHVAIELVDPETGAVVPWKDGAEGEMVYTAIARDATPVLRYRSRDHVRIMGAGRCACGRTSPRIRCIGRTDDMLIYKGMNVFPTSIRDLAMERFPGMFHPTIRVWREQPGQVRFDDPIAVEVEATEILPSEKYEATARELEGVIRSRLQVRVAISVLGPGGLPHDNYKNSLLATRKPARQGM